VASELTLARTFVELADTLVSDFEAVDLLHTLSRRMVILLEIDAAGVLLGDVNGDLRLTATSCQRRALSDLVRLSEAEGPACDSYRTGEGVALPDIAAARRRWPNFADAAERAGYAAVQALPLRLRNETIGSAVLFSRTAPFPSERLDVARGLADMAAIGILHHRVMVRYDRTVGQLQQALGSRVRIEQAKGILACQRNIATNEAFSLMRRYARDHNRKLHDVAESVIRHAPDVAALSPRPRRVR
jgi:GAF domain-containing protein